MTNEQIIATVFTVILVPAVIAEVKHRLRQAERIGKLESTLGFLQLYLLKNAVLEFHNNPNPETDKIIEKINAGEQISETELGKLKDKLTDIAENTPDMRKKLRAERTLELIKSFDWETSVGLSSQARDDLFNA